MVYSPVQVDKEEDKMLAETNQGGLHVGFKLASVVDLGRIEVVGVGQWFLHKLVDVPCDERRVQEEHDPVAGEQEKHARDGFENHLRYDELVELVAAGARVYVIALQVRDCDDLKYAKGDQIYK